jgi:hypothetical protein
MVELFIDNPDRFTVRKQYCRVFSYSR